MTTHSVQLSVVMTNYNHAQYLPTSLQAILDQLSSFHEFIIVDDASKDSSVAVIEKYAHGNPKVKFIRNVENKGVVRNINMLLEMVTGDFVYFASADDQILPGFFEKSLSLLGKYPEAALCSTLAWNMDAAFQKKASPIPHPRSLRTKQPVYFSPSQVAAQFSQRGNWIVGGTTIVNRQKMMLEGGFNETLRAYTDSFLYQTLALKYGACFISEPLQLTRIVPTSYSAIHSNDEEVFLKALSLMQNQYKNIYPETFVDIFKTEYQINVSKNNLEAKLLKKSEFILSKLENDSPFKKKIKLVFVQYAKKIINLISYIAVVLVSPRGFLKLKISLREYLRLITRDKLSF